MIKERDAWFVSFIINGFRLVKWKENTQKNDHKM